MKYGYYWYRKPLYPGSKQDGNIGDPLQSYVAIQMFKAANISEEDIIPINRIQSLNSEVSDVILCMNSPNTITSSYQCKYDILPPAPGIIPFYISFHLHLRSISEEMINNMRIYGPVGCRDIETMNNLREHGVPAYLSGCLTLTLPRRDKEPKNPKTFFVDVPEELKNYVPLEILANAEFITHRPSLPQDPNIDNENDKILSEWQTAQYHKMGYDILERYKNEAGLVVTSRLHAAAPCMAMGIPTILVNYDFDRRYDFIENLIPFYTPNLFDRINWAPTPIDLSAHRERMVELFTSKLEELKLKACANKLQKAVSEFFPKSTNFPYNSGWIKAIQKINKDKPISCFAIWGVVAESIDRLSVISNALPDCDAIAFIEKYFIEGEVEGLPIIMPEAIDQLPDDIVIFVIKNVDKQFAMSFLQNKRKRFVITRGSNLVYFEPDKNETVYPSFD